MARTVETWYYDSRKSNEAHTICDPAPGSILQLRYMGDSCMIAVDQEISTDEMKSEKEVYCLSAGDEEPINSVFAGGCAVHQGNWHSKVFLYISGGPA